MVPHTFGRRHAYDNAAAESEPVNHLFIFLFLERRPPHPLWPVPLPKKKKKKLILAWMNADVVISPCLLVLVFVTFSCKRMANVLQILQHKEIKKQKKIHDAPSTNNNTPCPPRFLAWCFIVREG